MTRARLVLLCMAFAAIGCDQLDPIKTTNLCESSDVVSENCPQCMMSPIAPECPQCRQDPAPPDCYEPPPATSANENGTQMGGEGAAGSGGEAGPGGGPSSGAGAANGGNAGRSGGAGPQGGAGKPGGAAAGGNGALPSGGTGVGMGAAGRGPVSTNCNDIGCPEPGKPGCLPSGLCVPCTKNEHCPNQVCDTANTRCVDCNNSDDCHDGKVCEPTTKTCIECRSNTDCKKDGLRACDVQATKCVECVDGQVPSTCQADRPACSMKKCVECTEDKNCPNDKPRCVTEDQRCVQCKESPDCARLDAKHPVCFTDDNSCVECLADKDCKSPTASHCNTSSHTCEPCNELSQCSHIPGLTVCDTAGHKCVECVDGKDTCNGNACILSSKTCSTVPYESRNQCEECQTRNECVSGMPCVEISTMSGKSEGGRCLLPSSNVACGRPTVRILPNVVSMDGFTVSVCAPPVQTSCKALQDSANRKPCSDPRSCGWGTNNDGICDSDTSTCTTQCKNANECQSPKTCQGATCK